jgi:SAM-dependent MidA family methyltransferase
VVVDAGAGPGTLAVAIRSAPPRCATALTYVLVERSAAQRALHDERFGTSRERGAGDGPRFVSAATLPAGPFRGVVLANELLDNLAFRVLERTVDGWGEVRVGEGLDEVLTPASAADTALAGRLAPTAAVGARIAVQQQAADWVADVLGRLRGGRLLVIDYATTTAAMAARPWSEWLRTYRSHRRGGHPLDDPGSQDITCEVAVDQLEAVRRPTRACSQAEWLVAAGIDALVDEGRQVWAERAHVGDLAALAARSRVREAEALCDPGGLGAFVVLEWSVPRHG